MAAEQFLTNGEGSKANPNQNDDIVEPVNDSQGGEPTDDQLAAAAAALNGASLPAEPAEGDDVDFLPEPPPIPPTDEVRMRIASEARERRKAEMVPGAGVGPVVDDSQAPSVSGEPAGGIDMTSQSLYYGNLGDDAVNFMGDALDQAATPAPAQKTPQPVEPGADQVTITVDGKQMQVSQDDLVRNYQINQSADSRLRQATELLQSAQNVAASQLEPTADVPQDQSEYDISPTEPEHEPGLDAIDYAGIAEKLMVGEVEEGADALKDLVMQAVERTQSRQDTASIDPAVQVETVANVVQDRTMSEQARTHFEQNYADIVADPQLYQIAQRNAVDAMIEDFAKQGADEQMIAHARANPAQAVEAHRALRISGQFQGMRSPAELYSEAGERTRAWVSGVTGTQAPVNGLDQNPASAHQRQGPTVPRTERARASQQSPAARQQPTAQPAPAPRRKGRSDVVADMKRARGQFLPGQAAG